MKKIFAFLFLIMIFIFSGCADKKYSQKDIGSINSSYSAIVVEVEGVKLDGDGTGSMLGMFLGFLIGSQLGDGAGNAVASFSGSVAGSVVGKKTDYLDGLKLKLKFDDGRNVVTVIKQNNENIKIKVGDKVDVLISRNKIIDIVVPKTEVEVKQKIVITNQE